MKLKKPIFTIVCIVCVVSLMYSPVYSQEDTQDSAEEKTVEYIDTHVHLDAEYPADAEKVDPAKKGKRAKKKKDEKHRPLNKGVKEYDTAAQNLIVLMDEMGVRKAVIMPPPQVPKQSMRRDYKELQKVVEKYPDRFVLSAGGYTLNPLIQASDPDEVSKSLKYRFQQAAEKVIHEGAKGFGEMSALHLSFNPQHPFSETAPDHPLFLVLSDTAAKYDVPIDLHMEAVQYDIPIPEEFKERSPNNPLKLKENISAFERLLVHNRGANIIWQHAGWDNTGHKSPDLLRKLLNKHTNLYLGLHVEEGEPMPNSITDKSGNIKKEWLALFRDFPDNFVIGSAEFVGIDGKTKPKPASFERTWSILEQLPPEVSEKIGKTNAQRLFHIR